MTMSIVNIPFKSLDGIYTVSMDIDISIPTKSLYNYIKGKIMMDLRLNPESVSDVMLFNYEENVINTLSERPFSFCCDSVQFPAFYFKVIIARRQQMVAVQQSIGRIVNYDNNDNNYINNAINYQPINTFNLVQQNEPE